MPLMIDSQLPAVSILSHEKVAADSAFELGYSRALDGIRGVAILAVMAFNGHLQWAQGGYLGVDIFFVLSGFLITSLLLQEQRQSARISLQNFYYRRALRLLPGLFALMLFVSVYAALLQSKEKAMTTWKGVLYTFFYVANWAQIGEGASGIGALSHAWSLSVEEQFYILWPLLLLLLLRSGLRRGWIVAFLLFCISASILWSARLWFEGAPHLRMYFGSDTRAHELLIGCLAALLVHWGVIGQGKASRQALRWISVVSLAAIAYALTSLSVKSGFLYCGGFALIALATAAIIVNLLLFPSQLTRAFEFSPLVWTGKISYGLYLWHFPVFEATRQLLEGRLPPALYEVLRFATVFMVAAASYYVIEKPFLKRKQRFSQTV
jgi:peptidoglycan/LPS O-acetylase OafA/YrhL